MLKTVALNPAPALLLLPPSVAPAAAAAGLVPVPSLAPPLLSLPAAAAGGKGCARCSAALKASPAKAEARGSLNRASGSSDSMARQAIHKEMAGASSVFIRKARGLVGVDAAAHPHACPTGHRAYNTVSACTPRNAPAMREPEAVTGSSARAVPPLAVPLLPSPLLLSLHLRRTRVLRATAARPEISRAPRRTSRPQPVAALGCPRPALHTPGGMKCV